MVERACWKRSSSPGTCISRRTSSAVRSRCRTASDVTSTGVPWGTKPDLPETLQDLARLMPVCSGVRRWGAAALDLCYVAAGRLDGFWETNLQAWDLAAGSLIIREAGGIVSGLDGSENYLETGHVLAGTPKIYAALARLCANDIRAMLNPEQ